MNENKKLTKDSEKVEETKNALADFIIRASQKGATPEEVQALPEVAYVFYKLFYAGLY